MQNSAAFSHFSRSLSANESIVVNAVGSAFRCTSGSAVFDVEPNEGNRVQVQAGIGFSGSRQYSAWRITNGATSQTIEFYIGDGEILDNRLVGAISITGGLKQAGNPSATYAAVSVGVTATVIKAANTDRSSILIQNLGSVDVYIGSDASVTSSNGIKIAAGASATLATQTAIYGIAGSAAQDVRYFEEGTV